jgi:chromosome segregation ATPase
MDQDVDKLDHLDKIRRLALLHRGKAPEVERERRPAGRPERSLTATLELLRQAGDAIKRVEERAHETEARSDMLLQRATEELKAAEARIDAAETRARTAEARVQELEEWLDRIHDVITQEILPVDLAEAAAEANDTPPEREGRLEVAARRPR